MQISKITRLGISDDIFSHKIDWWGRFSQSEFLSYLYDLDKLPSKDPRFSNAKSDIDQHTYLNDDWRDDWIFHDTRLELLTGEDKKFLAFLCRTIHPVVRPDTDDALRICDLYNQHLKNDYFEIFEKTKISGKPVFDWKNIIISKRSTVNAIKKTFIKINAEYIHQQIERMEKAIEGNDPDLAIGTAKELIETICKTILSEKNVPIKSNVKLPHLVKLTFENLMITPNNISKTAKASATIKSILGNLAAITNGLAELRNDYGTGHGRTASSKGLTTRHAKLAVGSASTLADFLWETWESKLINFPENK